MGHNRRSRGPPWSALLLRERIACEDGKRPLITGDGVLQVLRLITAASGSRARVISPLLSLQSPYSRFEKLRTWGRCIRSSLRYSQVTTADNPPWSEIGALGYRQLHVLSSSPMS